MEEFNNEVIVETEETYEVPCEEVSETNGASDALVKLIGLGIAAGTGYVIGRWGKPAKKAVEAKLHSIKEKRQSKKALKAAKNEDEEDSEVNSEE